MSPGHYLRKERLGLYLLTLTIGTAAQSTAAYCMFKYRGLNSSIQSLGSHSAHLNVNDITRAATLSMTLPVILIMVLNLELLVLIRPPRPNASKWPKVKAGLGIVAALGLTAAAVLSALTILNKSGSITGVDASTAQQYLEAYPTPPLKYRSWAPNMIWMVLLGINFVLGLLSLNLMHRCAVHEKTTAQYHLTDRVPPYPFARTDLGSTEGLNKNTV